MKNRQVSILITKLFILAFTTLSTVILFNYIVDPFQFFGKSTFLKPLFSTQERMQNPGLAKNYDYDTIIIGSSMTQNFVAEHIDSVLGGKSLKLSMAGSTLKEQRMMIDFASRTGKVKRVIWCIDAIGDNPNELNDRLGYEFPLYLYDENKFNDIRLLVETITTKQSIRVLLYNMLNTSGGEYTDIGSMNNWNNYYTFSKDTVLEIANKEIKEYEGKPDTGTASIELSQQVKENIQQNIFNVTNMGDTEFYIFYPPYSIVRHYIDYRYKPSYFQSQLQAKKYIFNNLKKNKNVEIFDFQTISGITFNLDNYKDTIHYSQKINEYIIAAIKNKENLVTEYNIESTCDMLEQQTKGFDGL